MNKKKRPAFFSDGFLIVITLIGIFGTMKSAVFLVLLPIALCLLLLRLKLENNTKKKSSYSAYVPPTADDTVKEEPGSSSEVDSDDSVLPTEPTKVERHHVAGTSYRQKELESLGEPNDFYDMTKRDLVDCDMVDMRIYQYDFDDEAAQLIEEPDNPYDTNAIKVVIGDVHIGYIKKGSCSHIKKLMREDRILDIRAEIRGGKYKIVFSDYDEYEREQYTLERGKRDYYATVSISVRD